ncbi:MAG: S-layer homology domain-containing protein, partial [Firmicutes bacterium]|nr:S-layer homology domain-containing protein [Bacillota bacterium]
MKTKQRRLVLILAVLLFTALLTGTAYAATYGDVSSDAWYADAVNYVSDHGLMTGVSDNAFAPDSAVTRGMIVTILYREAGKPAYVGKADFSDVADVTVLRR